MYPRYREMGNSKYWNPEDKAPMIYVGGVCKNEGKSDAKAGWGIKYGSTQYETGSDGGSVPGAQTAHRGQLSAVNAALERAAANPFYDKVSIVSNDVKLGREVFGKRAPGNDDLWASIDANRARVDASFETMLEDDDSQYFRGPLNRAKEAAGVISQRAPSGKGPKGSTWRTSDRARAESDDEYDNC